MSDSLTVYGILKTKLSLDLWAKSNRQVQEEKGNKQIKLQQ